MHPFLTLDDDTEIVHSDMRADGRVEVYVERPDEKICFAHATCLLPGYEWEDVEGFDADDIERYQEVIGSCAHLIMEFAKTGGFDRASGF